MSRREEMLARIRAATADITGLPEVPRRYAPAGRGPGSADEALVSRFEERASDYRATVRHSTAGEVAQVIGDTVAARGAERIGVPGGFPAPCPTPSRRWTRRARSPGSAGPARPATSSSAGSRACTARGPSTS